MKLYKNNTKYSSCLVCLKGFKRGEIVVDLRNSGYVTYTTTTKKSDGTIIETPYKCKKSTGKVVPIHLGCIKEYAKMINEYVNNKLQLDLAEFTAKQL